MKSEYWWKLRKPTLNENVIDALNVVRLTIDDEILNGSYFVGLDEKEGAILTEKAQRGADFIEELIQWYLAKNDEKGRQTNPSVPRLI
tara:strand:+ start:111 stop:374 length:264 start_codon:yes stop_codon:yes gene_type:complete